MPNKKPRNRPVGFVKNIGTSIVITEKGNLMVNRYLMHGVDDGVVEPEPFKITSDKAVRKKYTNNYEGSIGSFSFLHNVINGDYIHTGNTLTKINEWEYDEVEVLDDWENTPSGRTTTDPRFDSSAVIDTIDHGSSRPSSISHLTLEKDGYYLNTIKWNGFSKTLIYPFSEEEGYDPENPDANDPNNPEEPKDCGNLWAKTPRGWIKADAVYVKTSSGWVKSEENVRAKTQKGWR